MILIKDVLCFICSFNTGKFFEEVMKNNKLVIENGDKVEKYDILLNIENYISRL